jgi:hypothetical protein
LEDGSAIGAFDDISLAVTVIVLHALTVIEDESLVACGALMFASAAARETSG